MFDSILKIRKSFFEDLIDSIPDKQLENIIIKNVEDSLKNPTDIDQNRELEFTYETDDNEELIYATSFIVLLESLYEKYQFQPVQYVLDNIDQDIENLWRDWIKNLKALPLLFDKTATEELISKGILVDNLEKVDLSEKPDKSWLSWLKRKKNLNKIKLKEDIKSEEITDAILEETEDIRKLSADNTHDLLNEQITTISSIALGLSLSLKSKAYYHKNQNTKDLFNPRPNFHTAFNRLKNTVESGFVSTRSHALRKVAIFLFGDPEVYWVHRGDSKVCKFCLAIAAASPMKLSKMPYCPLHNHCRCGIQTRAEYESKSDEEISQELTDEAFKLTYYASLESASA